MIKAGVHSNYVSIGYITGMYKASVLAQDVSNIHTLNASALGWIDVDEPGFVSSFIQRAKFSPQCSLMRYTPPPTPKAD